jgi:hypothetical protein
MKPLPLLLAVFSELSEIDPLPQDEPRAAQPRFQPERVRQELILIQKHLLVELI